MHPRKTNDKMNNWLVQSIAPLATVAMMFGLTALCGCEKKAEVYTKRGEDPSYQEALKQIRVRQNAKAAERARIVSQMQELVDRACAALPKGASDEQVRAEIEGNPEKYPGWKALSAALTKANAGIEKEMAEARSAVRARILKEVADRKSVTEGRAVGKKSSAAK